MTMEEKKEKIEFSKEELEALNNDIEAAKQSLSSKTSEEVITKAKESAREELLAEQKIKEEQDAKDKKIEELQTALQQQQTTTSDTLSKLQEKIDSMASSKQVVTPNSPFKDSKSLQEVLNDPEKVQALDDASRDAFFKK